MSATVCYDIDAHVSSVHNLKPEIDKHNLPWDQAFRVYFQWNKKKWQSSSIGWGGDEESQCAARRQRERKFRLQARRHVRPTLDAHAKLIGRNPASYVTTLN